MEEAYKNISKRVLDKPDVNIGLKPISLENPVEEDILNSGLSEHIFNTIKEYIGKHHKDFISSYDSIEEVYEIHWSGKNGVDTIFIHKPSADIEYSKGSRVGIYFSKSLPNMAIDSEEYFYSNLNS